MAVAISGIGGSLTVRRTMTDVFNEKLIKSTPLDVSMSDADVDLLLEDEYRLTNAKYSKTKVTTSRDVTGLPATAVDALERNISNRAYLTFSKASPLDASETVYKTYGIPAFVDGLQNPDGSIVTPVTTGTDLPAVWTIAQRLYSLIQLLQDNLDYVAADGGHYPGGWTYQASMSGTGTVTNEIDGAF